MGQSIASKLKPEELQVLHLLACGQTLTVDDLTGHFGCGEDEVCERMAYLSMMTGYDLVASTQRWNA